jgi:hypothetical protein
MNKHIPHEITKTDQQMIQAIHNVISSIQHMNQEDIRNIDERIYFLTIPLPHIDEANRLKNITYTSIRKSFGFKDRTTKIGLIYCGDIAGTRNGSIKDLDWTKPHVHALMFLPHQVAPQSEKDHRRMHLSLTHELLSIREVKEAWNKGRDIDIRKYDPTRNSIFEMASYSYKAETRFIPQQANKFTTWTFPYDHKSGMNKIVDASNPIIQNLKFDLHLFPENVFSHPRLDRISPMQTHYRELYVNASSDVEQTRIRNRFLRLVS